MKMIENYASHGASSLTMEKFGDDLTSKIGVRPLLHRVCDIFSWIWCLFAWVFLLRFSHPNKLGIRTNAFNMMDKLRLLQLDYVQLHGSYKHFPTGLRWLSMHGFPLNYLPLELQLENIVALDMSYSNLQHLWKKPKLLRSLKFLILSFCHELVSMCGFDGFPLLERLILAGCSSLVEVCESIGNCDKLLLLDLSDCGKLRKLPNSIGSLKNLGTLSIDGCPNLGEFTMGIKDAESVEVPRADNVGIASQVSSSIIVYPRSLKSLTISLPGSLVSLSLKNNNLSNESFPASFGSLSMLKELCLDGNQIDSLPDCVRSLSRLMKLSLSGCGRLKTLLCAPRTLKDLEIVRCVSLERVTFHPERSSFPSLTWQDTKTLTEIEGTLKKHAISEIDEEMVCWLGWINRQHVKDDKFPTMSDFLKAHGKTFLEQTYGHGIFTTYFRGNRLPDWVTHISRSRELHFTLPSYGKSYRIRGLNVCFVITIVSNTKDVMFPETRIRNLTKRYPDNIYHAGWWIAPESNEEDDIVWLSHWSFENNEFENGDEVLVRIFDDSYIDVKEYGVSVVYDDDADDDDGNKREHPLADYKPWKLNMWW